MSTKHARQHIVIVDSSIIGKSSERPASIIFAGSLKLNPAWLFVVFAPMPPLRTILLARCAQSLCTHFQGDKLLLHSSAEF